MEYPDDPRQPARRRIVVTTGARRAIRRLCRQRGPHTVLLAFPGGAVCLPIAIFSPSRFDVIVGHVARCPIYADIRQLEFYARRRVALDVAERPADRIPLFSLRSLHHAVRSGAVPRARAAIG